MWDHFKCVGACGSGFFYDIVHELMFLHGVFTVHVFPCIRVSRLSM